MFKHILERKISFGEILSNAWSIYSKNFQSILVITLLVYVPMNIILYLIGGDMGDSLDIKRFSWLINTLVLFETFFGILVTMGVAVIVQKSVLSDEDIDINWRDALNQAVSRWVSCAGTSIFALLKVFILTMLLIVPGIIWMVYYSFISQIVVLKNLSGKQALDYSKSLVKGHWWEVFGTVFVIYFIQFLIALVIDIIVRYLPGYSAIITDTIINIVGAYSTVAVTIYFLNINHLRGQHDTIKVDTTIVNTTIVNTTESETN